MEEDAHNFPLDKTEFYYRDMLFDHNTRPDILARCENFNFKPDDIVVATFPRSGTTLTQEVIWHTWHHATTERDKNYGPLTLRFPFLEGNGQRPGSGCSGEPDDIEIIESKSGKRFMKTHLPFSLISNSFDRVQPKMIVTLRNPKDNAISLYHYTQGLRGPEWSCDWNSFIYKFMHQHSPGGDFFSTVLQWWSLRARDNVLILKYEDLVRQPHQEVRRVGAFLGCPLSADEVDVVVHNCKFDTMARNEDINYKLKAPGSKHLRKGEIGKWMETFTVAQNRMADRLIEERMAGSDLQFIFE